MISEVSGFLSSPVQRGSLNPNWEWETPEFSVDLGDPSLPKI